MPELKNKKHELFCIHYADCLNGTEAAKRAGYSEKTARIQASKLLANPNIQARKDELIVEKLGETKDELQYKILTRFKEIAFADVTQYVTIEKSGHRFLEAVEQMKDGTNPDDKIAMAFLDDLSEFLETERVVVKPTAEMENTAVISQIKRGRNGIEVAFHDPVKALEKLSEYAGLFEKKEDDKTVKVSLTVEERQSRLKELLEKRDGR